MIFMKGIPKKIISITLTTDPKMDPNHNYWHTYLRVLPIPPILLCSFRNIFNCFLSLKKMRTTKKIWKPLKLFQDPNPKLRNQNPKLRKQNQKLKKTNQTLTKPNPKLRTPSSKPSRPKLFWLH